MNSRFSGVVSDDPTIGEIHLKPVQVGEEACPIVGWSLFNEVIIGTLDAIPQIEFGINIGLRGNVSERAEATSPHTHSVALTADYIWPERAGRLLDEVVFGNLDVIPHMNFGLSKVFGDVDPSDRVQMAQEESVPSLIRETEQPESRQHHVYDYDNRHLLRFSSGLMDELVYGLVACPRLDDLILCRSDDGKHASKARMPSQFSGPLEIVSVDPVPAVWPVMEVPDLLDEFIDIMEDVALAALNISWPTVDILRPRESFPGLEGETEEYSEIEFANISGLTQESSILDDYQSDDMWCNRSIPLTRSALIDAANSFDGIVAGQFAGRHFNDLIGGVVWNPMFDMTIAGREPMKTSSKHFFKRGRH
jgi:hypothetical protein